MSSHSSNPGLHRALSDAMELLVDFNSSGAESMRTLQMYFVAAVLRRNSGNKCQAARRLGIHRNTMGRQITELHLDDYVRSLVGKQGPQLKLFHQPVRKGPVRSGLAQDVFVLNRNSQGKNSGSPQLSNRAASGMG